VARRTQPGFIPLAVGAAALADVVLTVQALTLGVKQEGEGRAAADAAVLVETVLLGEDGASAAFLCQLLLHFTETPRGRKGEREREREHRRGRGEENTAKKLVSDSGLEVEI